MTTAARGAASVSRPEIPLIGRARELRLLEQLLDDVLRGESRALVLCGDAGIGKSSLLDAVVASASSFETCRAIGVEAEFGLGYAGLHQLLAPLLERSDVLPPPQATSLQRAFGLDHGPAPDRFMLGLATASLLAGVASSKPLLCVIDDAQWIDPDSLELLGFAARHLRATRVAMVFSLREPQGLPAELLSLPQLSLPRLDEPDAVALLDSMPEVELGSSVRAQLVARAAGNPLALLEFAGELSPEERLGRGPLPEPLPVGATLRDRFMRQVAGLAPEAKLVALLAAAEPIGDPALLWRAAGSLGVQPTSPATAGLEPLLTLTPKAVFRHPLIRSAIYSGAPVSQRRQVHAALAAASDPKFDADRRAWHLAAAAVAPDEEVAVELVLGAQRAQRRSGYSAAAASLERAARLTPDEGRRAERLFSAAATSLLAGDPHRARTLLNESSPRLVHPLQRALMLRLDGRIEFARGRPVEAPPRLLRAATALQAIDSDLARDTFLEALEATFFAGRMQGRDARVEVAAAAQKARPGPHPTHVADLLLDGFTARLRGDLPAAARLLQLAITELRDDATPATERLRWMVLGSAAAGDLLDDEALYELASGWVDLARDEGALSTLPLALIFLARSQLLNGDFDAAEASVAQEREIVRLTGNPGIVGRVSYGDLFIKAWRGRERDARDTATEIVRDSRERGQGAGLMFAQFALAMLELGLGRFRPALLCARTLYDDDALYMGTHALPILVEAAVKAGEHEAAAAALERLSTRGLASGTPLALGLVARCRALTDGEEELYRDAIGLVGQSRALLELARSHLLFGEWLRDQSREEEAHEQLGEAHAMFVQMGATAFAGRASASLGPRPAAAGVEGQPLTERELGVLRLLATNLTVPEIAGELFLSTNTVKTHTKSIYRKLEAHRRSDAVERARFLGLVPRRHRAL